MLDADLDKIKQLESKLGIALVAVE